MCKIHGFLSVKKALEQGTEMAVFVFLCHLKQLLPPGRCYNMLTSKHFLNRQSDKRLYMLIIFLNTVIFFGQRVSAFTRSQAILEPVAGGKFSLFDGNVTGEFVTLVSLYYHDPVPTITRKLNYLYR